MTFLGTTVRSAAAIMALAIGALAASAPRVDAQTQAVPQPIAEADPIARLDELTEANHVQRLLADGTKSVIIAYSNLETSALQTELLTMMLRESHIYTGAVNFYRLDHARHPIVWSNVKHGAAWTTGPVFLLVNNAPKMIGTIVDVNNGVETPRHEMSSDRLRAEIARFFKVRLPLFHANVADVGDKVTAVGLPTFMMAYRSKGPKYDRARFQSFVYESQLYAGRVNFVMIDLDESDVSHKLGIAFPKQDDTYFVVYNPKVRDGAMIFDPTLTTKGMESSIRQYFGIEPARVVE